MSKSLNSLLIQNNRNFELIIINDGSTDNSLEILNNFNFQNLDYKIINQKNAGVSNARNNGVQLSKYEYIAFLDADDWWESGYLLNMVKLIEKYPEAGVWSCNYNIVKNDTIKKTSIYLPVGFIDGPFEYFKTYAKSDKMPVWTGATIIKKSLFQQLKGFKPNLKLGEDFDLWIRLSQITEFVFLNQNLSNYNQDVDLQSRAIGLKFYSPQEHVLFQDFGELMNDSNYKILFEKLFLYSMQPYYIYGKNFIEIKEIISKIDLNIQPFKYKLIYQICPRFVLKIWMKLMRFGSKIKNSI